MINAQTSVLDLLAISKQAINDVNSGETFIVKDLFRGFEWKRISAPDRTRLGSQFLIYAQSEGAANLEINGKTPQNQQMYTKR